MKKGSIIWIIVLLLWILVLAVPATRSAFMAATDAHPYVMGFIKFAILATMGDLLGIRVLGGEWIIPRGVFYKSIIWGIIGMMTTLVFTVYMGGTSAAQAAGRLPFKESALALAFFTSAIMNLTFGPIMMAFHRFTDMYIDSRYESSKGRTTISSLIDRNDWHSLVEFSWLKTCPFFWIPAHTIVFMLPAQFRVLISAFLSIALGLLLALAKKGKAAKAA